MEKFFPQIFAKNVVTQLTSSFKLFTTYGYKWRTQNRTQIEKAGLENDGPN